jgi:hypothetical protein
MCYQGADFVFIRQANAPASMRQARRAESTLRTYAKEVNNGRLHDAPSPLVLLLRVAQSREPTHRRSRAWHGSSRVDDTMPCKASGARHRPQAQSPGAGVVPGALRPRGCVRSPAALDCEIETSLVFGRRRLVRVQHRRVYLLDMDAAVMGLKSLCGAGATPQLFRMQRGVAALRPCHALA